MKALRVLKYVSFGGSFYGSDEKSHLRQLDIAKKLNETQFSDAVSSLELGRRDDGGFSSHEYYHCAGRMVTEKEFNQLQRLGVKDLRVLGIFQDGVTKWTEVLFWSGVVAFAAWNCVLLARFIGLV